jgi:hypothetical protein
MAHKKTKSKKRDVEIIQRIRDFFLKKENLYRGVTSLELSKAIDCKKETAERYLEIFIFFNSVKKEGEKYFYQHPATSPFPQSALTKLMDDVTAIYRESSSSNYLVAGTQPPKV